MVAEALKEAFGDLADAVHVGVTVTKVERGNQVVRYTTPYNLRRAIPIFDKTGVWTLPLGDYSLEPLSPTNKLGAPRKRAVDNRPGTRPPRANAPRCRNPIRMDTLCNNEG